MTEKLSWSVTAGSPDGSLDDSGSFDSEAVTSASVTVAASDSESLSVQLSNVSKVALLVIKASSYSGKVKVKGPGNTATEVKLTGPLVLFGADAVGLFNTSLSSITVTNDETDKDVDVEILLARTLTS